MVPRMRNRKTKIVLGTAISAGLVLSGPAANASTVHQWERVAKCESGGRWHLNTHNGYYGGLQISKATWRAYGGRRYSRLPNHASKRHQIRIARRIRRHQGRGAWPTCGRYL